MAVLYREKEEEKGRLNMKKFMKGCGIAALILLALGLALAITASTVRGRVAIAKAVETVTGGRVHIDFEGLIGWGIQARDSLPNPGYNVDDATSFDSNHRIWEEDVDKFCLGEAVEALKIEAGGCQFHTEISEDGSFYVKAIGIGRFQAYLENGTLYIRGVTGSGSWGSWKSNDITLYVPEGYHYKEADIALGAGELKFDGLEADQITLSVGAGQITAARMKTEALTAEIGLGEIDMKDAEVKSLRASVGMGNLEIEGTVGGNINVSCSMGNVEMRLTGSQEDFNYSLAGALGNIILGSESYSGIGVSKEIDNGAEKKMEVACDAGNITIKFTE